jgi:putative FmdB family regulatory protein
MPMYEYRCTECGDAFETVRSADERAAPVDCPVCGSVGPAERLWSTVAVRVKSGPAAPRNGAEALAGPGVRGLGTARGHGRMPILQASSCGGIGHRH